MSQRSAANTDDRIAAPMATPPTHDHRERQSIVHVRELRIVTYTRTLREGGRSKRSREMYEILRLRANRSKENKG